MPPAFRPVRPKLSGAVIQPDGFRDALRVHCCLRALRQLLERFGIRILCLLVTSRLITDCQRLADFAMASRSLAMRTRDNHRWRADSKEVRIGRRIAEGKVRVCR